MEKKEADPKYFTALQKIQTLLLRLETEMSKVFQHNATSKPEKWIEHLHQCQNVLTLCSDELCSWLTFWGLDNLGEKFRLLYHIHKTHINFMLNDYIHIFKKLQSNAFVEMNGVQFENSYQKLHEKVIYRQKPKQELLTMNVFEFQDQERAREIEEADRKAEEERKQRERTSRAEAEMALNKEINHVVDLRPIKTEDIAITPSILVDEGSGMIKRLIQIHENSAKDLESFLRDRKNLPKHKIEALMNHLTDMLDKAATGGEIIDSESDDLHDAFVESLKDKEEFRQTLETFDQKQRDLIVRALVYYRKLNTKVKIDKATEPDLKIFDLDEAIHEQERLGRVINELEKENREKYGTIKNLKINLDSKTELLQKSVDKNRSLEAELASFKSQIELFRKELSDKNNVLYGQAEKVVQLKDQEKIANDLKTELKKAESKLETTTRELTALKEEVALSKSRRDDSTFLDSFQIESRERNKTMFIGNKNIDLRAADLEIEDRQRSKSMSPVKTDFQQPAAMEPQDKDTKILSQDVLDSPKKKLEINLVQIEESNSSVVQSSGQTTPVEPKIEPKRTISPLKKKVSAIANFRGQETKKGNALEEILKKQGLEDDSSMIMESIKDEINGKRSLPLRTMSLADFNPANENIPKLPRLMAKPRSRKNDIHKRMNQKGEYMRSLSPIKHARNGAGPVAELAALQAEKEKAYQALVERSLGLYKPLPQIRFNTLQKYKGLNERKSGRELGGSFEVDSYKSGEKGVYDLAKSAYNLQGGNQDYVPQDGDAITTGSAWRSNKEQNLNYSVDKQKHFYPSCVSLQSSGLDLEEIVTAKSKNMGFNNIVSEREVEALYAFLLHDSESAASKLNLMQNMLKIKPEDKKNDSPMEKDIKGSSSLKNVENFKEAVKEWLIEHRTCGQECPHLQRFYDKINFRKQFADIMLPRENTKKVMKIPLAVLAGPLPAETQDTGRKRYKGTL